MENDITTKYVDAGKITYPKILYKYRDWDNLYHKGVLTENKIFLSPPREFEDKMDCNVPEKFPLKIELYELFIERSKKENPRFSRQQHRKYARDWSKKSPLANPKQLKNLVEKFNEDFNNRFGVCSVTADPYNLNMWKKYGNNSKGICIGFNSEKLFSIVGGGGEIRYVDDLPVIDFVHDDFETKHVKNIMFKEKQWSFEKEYRLHKFWESNANLGDRNIVMPKDCIVEVILGKNISDANKKEITELIQQKHPNVAIVESEI
jgi:hypothetical protein